jgi:hypothetical protein
MHILPLHRIEKPMKHWRHSTPLLIVLVLLVCPYVRGETASSAQAIIKETVPVPGWKSEGEVYVFNPSNLYTYINGAADFFIAYGFVELAGANYTPIDSGKDAITVDIYDMGNPLNAFGVFQSRRDDALPSLNIGTASLGADGYLVFYKDRYYVEIQALITEKETAVIQTTAQSVAEHIPGDNAIPMELSFFPEKNKIAGSERYIRGGILGHAFLDRGIVCGYRMGTERASTFIAFVPSSKDAIRTVEIYRKFLQGSGKQCSSLDGFGEQGFASEEPYHKNIIIAGEGAFVVGVYDITSVKKGTQLLKDVIKTLNQKTAIH